MIMCTQTTRCRVCAAAQVGVDMVYEYMIRRTYTQAEHAWLRLDLWMFKRWLDARKRQT